MTGISGFVVKWCAEDVVDSARRNGWDITLEAARNWLAENQRRIMDRMTEDGNEMLYSMTQCVDDWSKYESKKISSSTRLHECIYNISMEAANLIIKGKIAVEDSRDLFLEVEQLANDFEVMWERNQMDDKGEDYLLQVITYAEKKLLERYGVDK